MKNRKHFTQAILITLCTAIMMFSSVIMCNAAVTDNDGTTEKLSIQDITTTQRILAEFEEETDEAIEKYDVNHNGRLDILDVTIMQRTLAEFKD